MRVDKISLMYCDRQQCHVNINIKFWNRYWRWNCM